MAPRVTSAKATLSYPLYGCDFDPLDSSRLVVGGGGGAGRSGVGNKLTLLNTSNPKELEEVSEIDLSKDEDNVTSLAVGQKKGKATLVFAGVNSDPTAVAKGQNLHFRVFGIEPPAAAKGRGKAKAAEAQKASSTDRITEVSRSALFDSKGDKDVYQRVTRLSRPYPNLVQLGAVASSLAKKPELVLFDTATTSPKARGTVPLEKEVMDVDFFQTGKKEYLLAYCDIHDVYVKKISDGGGDEEPAVSMLRQCLGHPRTRPYLRSAR